jgi:preprotein translocase subunit SecE
MKTGYMVAQKGLAQKATSWPVRFKNYIQDLQIEMRRVTWPSWKQVRATTAVVIVTVFIFAAYFWVVDTILGRAMNKIIEAFRQ